MTEQQLRDVLARVVPEPPDSVADAGPVLRVARRQRRVRVAGVGALAAVLVAGTGVGIWAATVDRDADLRVSDRGPSSDGPPTLVSNPFLTAPCPDPGQSWEVAPVTDLSQVTAVRFCARPVNGFDPVDGPQDGLVVDLAEFTDSLATIAQADPARCAAVDVLPSDSRLLFQLRDGSTANVPAGPCQDAQVGGRTLDGDDLTTAFLAALAGQRADHDYTLGDPEPPSCDSPTGDVSPALPGQNHLVAASLCGKGQPQALTAEQLADLDQAWASATTGDTSSCTVGRTDMPLLFVRTDHGDNLQLEMGCDDFTFHAWDGTPYTVPLSPDLLLG